MEVLHREVPLLVDILCRSPEKEYSERMVLNPIYTNLGTFHGSSESRDRYFSLSVAQNPQYGMRPEVVPATYEIIGDFPTQPKAGKIVVMHISQNHTYNII